jgi:hypothetical protein
VESCHKVPEYKKDDFGCFGEKSRSKWKKKALQCIIKDDKDEGKEISWKDKGKGVTSGSRSTQTTMNQLLKKDLREKACW